MSRKSGSRPPISPMVPSHPDASANASAYTPARAGSWVKNHQRANRADKMLAAALTPRPTDKMRLSGSSPCVDSEATLIESSPTILSSSSSSSSRRSSSAPFASSFRSPSGSTSSDPWTPGSTSSISASSFSSSSTTSSSRSTRCSTLLTLPTSPFFKQEPEDLSAPSPKPLSRPPLREMLTTVKQECLNEILPASFGGIAKIQKAKMKKKAPKTRSSKKKSVAAGGTASSDASDDDDGEDSKPDTPPPPKPRGRRIPRAKARATSRAHVSMHTESNQAATDAPSSAPIINKQSGALKRVGDAPKTRKLFQITPAIPDV